MPSRSRHSERGAGSVELAVTVPLLLLLILVGIQTALWAHAIHITRAAASAAAEATRQYGATTDAGRARADQLLHQLGRRLLISPHVTVTRGQATAHVTVTARIQQVIPGLHLYARADATSPVERFVPDQDQSP